MFRFLLPLIVTSCLVSSGGDPTTKELRDLREASEVQESRRDAFKLSDVPRPQRIVIGRPQVIAYPGDDINEIVRNNAQSGKLFVLGIVGKNPGSLRLGKKYGAHTKDEGDIVIQVVGVPKKNQDPPEIRGVHLYGQVGKVKRAEFHNLRISTSKGARSPVLDINKSGRLVFNKITLLPDPENMEGFGGAGMKWGFDLGDGSDYLHIHNCRRGVLPSGEKVRYEEHWAYLKSTGNLFITNNDISGGNRTGFQVRTPGGQEPPHGPMVIMGNYARDYGWDWDVKNGGSCITIWESLDFPVYIINNSITNAKYGCVAIAHQPPEQESPLLPSGRAHSKVVLWSNIFTNPKGDRSAVSISSTEKAQVLLNRINGAQADLVIDSETAWKWGARPCRKVTVAKELKKSLDIIQWNGREYVEWK